MSQKKDEVTKVTEWNRPETTGKIPSKRSGHTLSLVESSIYLFGGCTAHASNGKPVTTNELFCLDISQGNNHWTVPTTAVVPDSRWHHTANVFDNSKIVYFGGFHDNVKRLNDVCGTRFTLGLLAEGMMKSRMLTDMVNSYIILLQDW